MTLHFSHIAMGTRFEMWLCGADPTHLQSVAFLAWEEVDRLELLLSRYDPRAEIARINREAAERPTRVEVELFNLLQDCQEWAQRTNGYFDITYESPGDLPPYTLDPAQRTVYFAQQGVLLDLGGYGKGYALDRVVNVLRSYGITSACVHGGRSSVVAIGIQENGHHWTVAIPHHDNRNKAMHSLPLLNQGFSYSATVSNERHEPDIINPHQHTPCSIPEACWVLASSALEAEVWTTALLAMGRNEAEKGGHTERMNIIEMDWI